MTNRRLIAFVSSKMEELRQERQIVKAALDELQIDTFVFEYDAGARASSIQHTYLCEVENADLFIGIFWKGYGERTIEELDHARKVRKDCLVYEKQLYVGDLRDSRLADFLRLLGDVESGVTSRRFANGDELAKFVKSDVAAWQYDIVRRSSTPEKRRQPRAPSGNINVDGISAAADELLRGWINRFYFDDHLGLIDLQLTLSNKRDDIGNAYALSRAEVVDRLNCGERLVLQAAPGAGKSVTLLQIAGAVKNDGRRIPLFVRLPAWAEDAGGDLIDHLARLGPFRGRGITGDTLAAVAGLGCVFLLDGWNEVRSSQLRVATERLEALAASFPDAGILIASRPVAVPPLGATKFIHLRALSGSQRRRIVQARLGSGAPSLLARVENDPGLNATIRTPLLLDAVMRLAENQVAIPSSRYGILRAFIENAERDPAHAAALRGPVMAGGHREYLTDLAGIFGERGSTLLPQAEALTAVSKTAMRIGVGREPGRTFALNVLDELCAHHLLERTHDGQEAAVQFVHEQLQEWFSSAYLQPENRRVALGKAALRVASLGGRSGRGWQRCQTHGGHPGQLEEATALGDVAGFHDLHWQLVRGEFSLMLRMLPTISASTSADYWCGMEPTIIRK